MSKIEMHEACMFNKDDENLTEGSAAQTGTLPISDEEVAAAAGGGGATTSPSEKPILPAHLRKFLGNRI